MPLVFFVKYGIFANYREIVTIFIVLVLPDFSPAVPAVITIESPERNDGILLIAAFSAS